MRTGIIVALSLAAIAGIVIGVRYLQDTGSADYQPEPAFTNEEGNFILRAHEMLETATFMDDEAARRAHLPSVRDFATKTASDHRHMQEQLASAVRSLDPDFVLDGRLKNPTLEHQEGIAYDGDYLQDFITRHDEMRTTIEEAPSIHQNPALARFVSLWQANASGHTREARNMLMDLPDTASYLPLLILAGVVSLGLAALLMKVSTRRAAD